MGHSFSSSTFKVKLGICVKRMSQQINKKNNFIKVQRREIAQLLADSKSESARIRVETLFHELDMIRVMEILSVMCELLSARTAVVASEKVIPDDLYEPAATLIYCAKRLDIPEFVDVAHQLAYQFGEEWAKSHVHNQYDKVNRTVLQNLGVHVPNFEEIIEYLKGIATQYKVDWEPDLIDPTEKKDNASKIGSIATGESKRDLSHPADPKSPLGTLSVTVHSARKLYAAQMFGKQDPYVTLTMDKVDNVNYHTKVMKNAGDACEFEHEHFPFLVKEHGLSLRVELFNRGALKDDFIGRVHLDVDQVIQNPEITWFRIGRDSGQKTFAGEVAISAQFMPFLDPNDQEASPRHEIPSPNFVPAFPVQPSNQGSKPNEMPQFPSVPKSAPKDADDDLEERFRKLRGF